MPHDNPLSAMLRDALEGAMRTMMVCLPGRVEAFDPERQRAQILPGIRAVAQGQPITLPVIDDVPVHFAGNAQWYAWHEVTPGTEGLIHFSQRAIDTWIESGGPATPQDYRMFSMSDAFFVPGVRSNPGVIPGFVNEGCGLSDFDGGTRIHLTGGRIVIRAGRSTITIDDAGVAVNGRSLTHNGTNVGDTHRHGGVQGGNSNTGVPQ